MSVLSDTFQGLHGSIESHKRPAVFMLPESNRRNLSENKLKVQLTRR